MELSELIKNSFAETLRELLRTHDLKDIRVSELCRMSHLSRRTFYNHFQDKYDLAAWLLLRRVGGLNMVMSLGKVNALTTESFKEIMTNYSLYRRIYSDPGISNLMDHMLNYYYRMLEEVVLQQPGREALTIHECYVLRTFVYGSIYLTREWILNGCRLSPDELASIFLDALPTWMRA